MRRFAVGFLAAMGAFSIIGLGAAEATADEQRQVWGGGDPSASAYSGQFVPYVIELLDEARLSGYQWGGATQGTVDNIRRVSENPTNLAVGQLDILRSMKNSEEGAAVTILHENLGPECLYLVTSNSHYNNWGHVLANTWDITLATGGEMSGSYGTWGALKKIYPDLDDVVVDHVGGIDKIVDAVTSGRHTFGFFVMRPSPDNAVFQTINDNNLTLVPVIDFELEGHYDFRELKIGHGGLWDSAVFHPTACTSVALFTGDSSKVDPSDTRSMRRLEATIERIGGMPEKEVNRRAVEMFTSWRDFADNLRDIAGSQLTDLMQTARDVVDRAAR